MQTMNVSLPDTLKAFVDEQVSTGGYSSVSEYVRDLLRAAQERKTNERLQQLLLEGMESGEGIEATPEFWTQIKRDIAKRIASHQKVHGRK